MNRVIFVFLLLTILCQVLPSSSLGGKETDNPEQERLTAFLEDIRHHSAGVTSFLCDFTQEKQLTMFDRPVIFSGKLALIRPDKLRWEFTEPFPSVLIFNESRGLRCSDNSEPVVFNLAEDPVMRVVGEQLRFWLSGDYLKGADRYQLTMEHPATLVVQPKDSMESEYISSVKIRFNLENLQPQEVEIAEAGGDLTRIILQAPVINSTLPEDLFLSCGFDG